MVLLQEHGFLYVKSLVNQALSNCFITPQTITLPSIKNIPNNILSTVKSMLIFLPDDFPVRNLYIFFRTVKFWDLETFQLVSSTDPETGGVRWVNYLTAY